MIGIDETIDQYTEPAIGSRAEAVAAALKAHRSIAALQLSSRTCSATGRALPAHTTFLLDVWRCVVLLPDLQRDLIIRYYVQPEAMVRLRDGSIVPRDPDRNATIGREKGMNRKAVIWYRQQGIKQIEAWLWPGEGT